MYAILNLIKLKFDTRTIVNNCSFKKIFLNNNNTIITNFNIMPSLNKLFSKILLIIFVASNFLPAAALAIKHSTSSSVQNNITSSSTQHNTTSLIRHLTTDTSATSSSLITQPLQEESTTSLITQEIISSTTFESTNLTTATNATSSSLITQSLPEETTATDKTFPIDNTPQTITENFTYSSLMRQAQKLNRGNRASNNQQKILIAENIEQLINQETERLNALNISNRKLDQYLKRLQSQANSLNGQRPLLLGTLSNNINSLFTSKKDPREVKRPQNPGRFNFEKNDVKIKKLEIIDKNNFKPSFKARFKNTIENIVMFFKPQKTLALAEGQLPNADDLSEDGQEIIVNSQIKTLAESLNHNPVHIFNYVRNNISYEPYYGAKKGNLGCLEEKICNDIDSASLTISLLRASGIPARYKTSLVQINIELLKSLLAVDEAKTVYAAFYWNKIPIYVSNNSNIDVSSQNIDNIDFSNETHFIIEQTFVDYFYEYDERGANISNIPNLETIQNIASSTSDIQAYYSNYPKAMWMSTDTIIKPYTHIKNEIIAQTASFNTQDFWNNYLSYQGELTPIEKYRFDLKTQTNKDIDDANYQSKREIIATDFDIIPPALPFKQVVGQDDNGNLIEAEVWASLPESKKNKLTISLKQSDNDAIVLTKTFNASQVNNTSINIYYEGTTQADKDIIKAYGGIHQTPTELVDLTTYLLVNNEKYLANENVNIGDSLILEFNYLMKGESIYIDEKFSTAGNSEGIYLIFSQVQENSFFDDPDKDENLKNSHILLEGNAEIARQYLRHLAKTSKTLSKALDMGINTHFARAVVTQNRILSKNEDGTPTTFDFKGLSIDATSYIVDYSRQGSYSNNRQDFHLLYGLDASYHEGNIFESIAGLEAISTVKGLQYAYANSGSYTIHTITSDNENVIDSLDLSQNTKDNMHADVQDGNTIITPNKLVQDNNWYGLFYVSLEPDGSAMYAIGEQVQSNGGWTVKNVLQQIYIDQNNEQRTGFLSQYGGKHFYYEDRALDSIKCSITDAEYNLMTSMNDWNDFLGYPCLIETRTFGIVEHSYFLASNYTYFLSNNNPLGDYSYWTYKGNVKSTLSAAAVTNNINVSNNGFKFNIIAGTYSWFAGDSTIYYQPKADKVGKGRVVTGKILKKLMNIKYDAKDLLCNIGSDCYKKNWVLDKLGFPTSNQSKITNNYTVNWGRDIGGEYQDFIGGQIYIRSSGLNKTYYVDGRTVKKLKEEGGSSVIGLPIEDPYYSNTEKALIQHFDSGKKIKVEGTLAEIEDNTITISIAKGEELISDENFNEGFYDSLLEQGVTGILIDISGGIAIGEIIMASKESLKKRFGKAASTKAITKIGARFLPVVGWVFGGWSVYYIGDELAPLVSACNANSDTDGKPASYYCGKVGAYGMFLSAGLIGDIGYNATKNIFGVSSDLAKRGKTKLFGLIKRNENDQNLEILQYAIRNNKKTRDKFFEKFKKFDDDEIKIFLKDRDLIERSFKNDELDKNFLELILELKKNNIKTTSKDIINITKLNDGRIIFLEEGTLDAGWRHVTENIKEGDTMTRLGHLINDGIVKDSNELKSLMFKIAREGSSIDSGYELLVKNNQNINRLIKLIVGDNGFIVTIRY